MKVTPIILIQSLSGKLYGRDGFYFRKSKNGTIYACKCPNRDNHIKTPAEAANQKRFAEQFAGKNKPSV